MADLAIGISKKVVDGLVKKVEGAIKEEQELWQTVERDSVFIKDEFEMMKSFLKTADRDRVRNSVVRTWVRQVRDLSYDAEDCIDGIFDLEPKRPWWALPFRARMLPTWCRPEPRVGRALDEAVDKIKLIKARVEEVSHRNLRYNLINTTGSSGQGQLQLQLQAGMDMDMDMTMVQEGSFRLRCLLDYEGCQRRVISIWGTGGSLGGTISLIRSVFDDPSVCRGYECRAWVKLMHPFSPQKLLGDLVAQLLINSGSTCGGGADGVWSTTEASSVLKLAKEFEQLVKGRSYLIVLEDLSNIVEWDTIRAYLPDEKNGSRVIVSTQHRELARMCTGQPHYVQELSQLSSDHSVYAFFKEKRMPSQQNQGSANAASLSAAANYWCYLPVLGRDDEARRLHDLISSSERRYTHVVTVWGPPNIGKLDAVVAKVCSQLLLSTPARSMNDRSDGSFQLYGWVDVPEPFHVLGFCESLLSVMDTPPYARDPVWSCSYLLRRFRCLVVINGLKCTEDCSKLAGAGLIYGYPNSCIVVVTTEESVATYWTEATSADRFKKATSAVCKIEPIPHEFIYGQQGQLPTPRGMDDQHIARFLYMANCCFRNYPRLVGRDKEVGQLSSMISSSRVVVIQGPPGVGKTALVEKVYSQFVLDQLATQQFALCGWVQVSESDPFNLMAFSRSLLSVLRPQSLQSPDPIRECSKLVQDHSCLIVIDGLQCAGNFWELARAGFIHGHAKSCILLITTEKSLTTTCMASLEPGTHALFQVEALHHTDAERLFREVYGTDSISLRGADKDLVVDKCCGLPIVIVGVAKYLTGVSKAAVTQLTAAAKDGKFIHELATYPQPEFVGLKGLLAWVDSALKACPESSKLLIWYMLNFSKETVVRRKRLVRRWIAEGYIKNAGICDMVTEAEERLRELEDLTIMMTQVPAGRRDITWHGGYRLSGLSGEVLMAGAAEDQLFIPLEVSALTQGKKKRSLSTGRHLRIDGKWEGDEFVFRSLDLTRLRSLTVSGEFKAFFINDSMRVLRVLDLEDAKGVEYSHLEKIPKLLRRLRFLSVRGSRRIDRLPDSIGDLRQLQTLDIRRTMITTLPVSILKLRKLQCLRAGHTMKARTMGDPYILPAAGRSMSSRLRRGLASCSWAWQHVTAGQGVTIPRGMSQLTDLHTLGIVNVNTADGEAILEELQHFQQLRKVELYGINSCNMRGLRHPLPYNLDSLSLVFTASSNLHIRCLPVPKSLKLHGHVGILEALPDDIDDIGVTDLTLEIDTSLTEDNLKRIGKLPMVRTLRLHFHTGSQEGGKLRFDADYGFHHQLEVLEITSSLDPHKPLCVEFAPGAVKSLGVLKLVGSLVIDPDGLHDMVFLKEVWIEGTSSLWLEITKARHRNNPAVINYESWQFLREPLTEFVHVPDLGWIPRSSSLVQSTNISYETIDELHI